MRLSHATLYGRLLASDPTYDGRFFTGVLTTGIYCLPSCRAKKPKAENVRFFPSCEAARAAGLRPCKKCHPDDYARGADPVLETIETVVAELRADPARFPDAAALVRRTGYGATRAHELFRQHFHATPAELLAGARLDAARQSLLRADRPLADVAFASGYESLSAFHDAFRIRTGLTPAATRALARPPRAPTPSSPPDRAPTLPAPSGRVTHSVTRPDAPPSVSAQRRARTHAALKVGTTAPCNPIGDTARLGAGRPAAGHFSPGHPAPGSSAAGRLAAGRPAPCDSAPGSSATNDFPPSDSAPDGSVAARFATTRSGPVDRVEAVLSLPTDYPLDLLLAQLGRDPQSLAERLEGAVYRAATRLADQAFPLVLDFAQAATEHTAKLLLPRNLSPSLRVEAAVRVSRLLGLAQDAAGFARLAKKLGLARLVDDRESLRLPQYLTPWDALLWAILGQQINLPFAFRLRRALTELAGTPVDCGLVAPPSPADVAALPPSALAARQFSRQKIRTLLDTARLVAEGSLDLEKLAAGSATRAERALLSVRGLGPWTVNYVLMRGLGFSDCTPYGDTGLSGGLQRLFALDHRPDVDATRHLMLPFSPQRSLATAHLWQLKA